MMQDSKEGQSSITGANTFYGANKGKTLDSTLSKYTVVLTVIFCILCVVTTICIMN